MNKKPPSLAAQAKEGARRFERSKGSTDAEYDRARMALEKANEAREASKNVTLAKLNWIHK